MVTEASATQRTIRKKPKPEVAWIQEEAEQLKTFWDPQRKRMDEDQKLYELVYEEPEEGFNRVVLNYPRVLVNKVKRMIAAADMTSKFDPDDTTQQASGMPDVTPMQQPVAQKDDAASLKEKVVAWFWEEADRLWREGLNEGLKETFLTYLLNRGAVAGRIKLAAEDGTDLSDTEGEEPFPFELTPIDPINLYPRLRGRKVGHYLHIYKTTWGDVAADWDLQDDTKKDSDECEVVTYYDDTYWAVLVDSLAILEPTEHGYGFCPIVMMIADGGSMRTSQYTTGNEWVKFHGCPLLEDIRRTITDRNTAATMRKDMLDKSINPTVVATTEDGKPIAVDTTSGARIFLKAKAGEGIVPMPLGANAPDLAKLEADFDQGISLGTLPLVMFGQVDGALSGYATSLLSKSARDVLVPWLNAMKGFVKSINVRVLKLLVKPDLGVSVNTIRGATKAGRFSLQFDPAILGNNFRHEVEFGDILPSDLPALIEMGNAATQGDNPLLSAYTVREQWLQSVCPDNKGERARILRERSALMAMQSLAQLGLQALQRDLGESGMTQVFGEPTGAPTQPVQPAGMSNTVLPPAETGLPPTAPAAPGSPEELALAQSMQTGAAPVPMGV